MIIVLDASAAIALALKPKNHKGMADLLKKADWVIAPDLILSEVANVCWKYHRFEGLPMELCEELLEKSLSLIDDFIDTRSLCNEAFSFACASAHPVYDMMYLVLSRRKNGAFITKDKRLKKLAGKYSIKVL